MIELRLALIAYQDYHMLLLTLAGHGWRAPIFVRNDNSSKPGDTTERVFRAKLVVTNKDGTSSNILNLGNWEATAGPILADSVYDGEIYDARRALPVGWDAASTPSSWPCSSSSSNHTWTAASAVSDAPRGKLGC